MEKAAQQGKQLKQLSYAAKGGGPLAAANSQQLSGGWSRLVADKDAGRLDADLAERVRKVQAAIAPKKG